MAGAGIGAECGEQFATRRRGQESGAESRGIREESAGEFGGGGEDAGQFQGAQGGQIGVQRRQWALGASGAYDRGGVRQSGVQAAFRFVRDDPGAQGGQLAPGQYVARDYCHIADRRAGQRRGHGVLREGEGEPGAQAVGRGVREPALRPRQGFQGYDQGPLHARSVPPLPHLL
jgi:hypothetical protein